MYPFSWTQVTAFSLCKCMFWDSTLNSFFQLVPLPTSVHLDRHWRHSFDKCSQAFPLHCCILQAITRGARLKIHYMIVLYVCASGLGISWTGHLTLLCPRMSHAFNSFSARYDTALGHRVLCDDSLHPLHSLSPLHTIILTTIDTYTNIFLLYIFLRLLPIFYHIHSLVQYATKAGKEPGNKTT